MYNSTLHINWIAIFAATAASSVLGGLWFTLLFGKQYAAALNRPYDSKQKPAPLFIVGPLVCGLVTNVATAILLRWCNVTSYGEALVFALVAGIGMQVAIMMNTAINPNMPRPFAYSMVSGPYFLMSCLSACLILTWFR